MIYGPSNDNGIWLTRYNNLHYVLYDELGIVKVVKVSRKIGMAETPLKNASTRSLHKTYSS